MIIHFPDLMFVYLSHVQPDNFFLINAAVALEQFGYGFGFTAYMLYMILVSEGEHKTAHYAICTGFMALGMMMPGMFSGALQEMDRIQELLHLGDSLHNPRVPGRGVGEDPAGIREEKQTI